MFFTESRELASMLRRLTTISWSALYAVFFNYILYLTHHYSYFKNCKLLVLTSIPPIACFIIYFFNPIPSEYMIKINGGWAYAYPSDLNILNQHFFNFYYATYIITSLVILILYINKTKIKREKVQMKHIIASIIVATILGTITDVILPFIGFKSLPPLTVILIMILIATMWISTNKYGLMDMSRSRILIDSLDIISEGIIILDDKNNVESINLGAKNILGFNEKETIDIETIKNAFPNNLDYSNTDYDALECCLVSNTGKILNVLLSSQVGRDKFGDPVATIIYFQDITEISETRKDLTIERDNLEIRIKERTESLSLSNERLENEIELRKINEKEIKRLAYTDYITDLPNRRMFSEVLEREIDKSLTDKKTLALLFIDLDGFKIVNDTLGHNNGDILLSIIAKRIRRTLRSEDYVARLGGDEFGVLLFDPYDYNSIYTVCDHIMDAICKPCTITDTEVRVSASIGISACPNDGTDSTALIKYADIAMYDAKEHGRGCYSVFDKKKEAGIEEIMRLTNDLYSALDNNEFIIHYQPQVSTYDKKIISLEALIRWEHPELGRISPYKFIPIAERTGLILQIGEWVFKKACKQLKIWNDKFGLQLRMAINISVKQLENPYIIDTFKNALTETEVDPNFIELEITENMLMKDISKTVKVLKSIKDLGLSIAIDDFGTEYSSLNYIKHLTVDRLKLPKPFIDGINQNSNDEFIISSTMQMAKKLELAVVAEGVEQEYQYKYLKQLKCDIIQGYYFFRPMDESSIESILKNNPDLVSR